MRSMRIETFLFAAGVVVGILGLCLLLDAWADDAIVAEERRQFRRIERDRKGEALVGLGVLTMSVTLFVGEAWRYSVIAVIVGTVLMFWGMKRNASYIRAGLRRS